ncbi:putative membrane protein [Saccharothrix espanaensis DSM 44229]|uniref:Putative membrane protein n=1 Tax=Saccharothrix espanaensis (strain ATCC 51144 / DSM 44229 / JCM 9112 / NBRC 15066 / NRRL 15764) TaxID=1179773 RepID=K0K2S8_SACES|nr:putative membrane protein [Saccharothrix espanaensis DSM 44229]
MVGVLLLLEMGVVAQPALRAGLSDLAPAQRALGPIPGMLLAACTILLVTAGTALVTMLVRPFSRTWVATYAGAHAAAAGLGWAHEMPLLTLVAVVCTLGVPALVLLPGKPSQ